MESISLPDNTNFFEKRVRDYQKAGVLNSTKKGENSLPADNDINEQPLTTVHAYHKPHLERAEAVLSLVLCENTRVAIEGVRKLSSDGWRHRIFGRCRNEINTCWNWSVFKKKKKQEPDV